MTALALILRPVQAAGRLAVEALREWTADRCEGLAAALALHALLAIVPFLAIVVGLAESLLGEGWTRAHLAPQVQGWAGPRGTIVLQFLDMDLEDLPQRTLVTLGVLGTVSLVMGASGFFMQMKDALETIWGVYRGATGLVAQVRKRLLGLLYAGGSALIALAGFAGAGLLAKVSSAGPALAALLTYGVLASFWLKVLPPVRLRWGQILPWAGLIAVLHLLGRQAVWWYAGMADDGKDTAVDVAAALLLVLLWFYYASMTLLYGVTLMRVYMQRRSLAPEPATPPAPPRLPEPPGAAPSGMAPQP